MSQIFIKLEFQNWIDEIFFIEKKNIVLSTGYEEVPQFESRIHRIEIINYFFYFKRSKRKTSEKLRNFLFIQNQYNVNKQHYRKEGEFY